MSLSFLFSEKATESRLSYSDIFYIVLTVSKDIGSLVYYQSLIILFSMIQSNKSQYISPDAKNGESLIR